MVVSCHWVGCCGVRVVTTLSVIGCAVDHRSPSHRVPSWSLTAKSTVGLWVWSCSQVSVTPQINHSASCTVHKLRIVWSANHPVTNNRTSLPSLVSIASTWSAGISSSVCSGFALASIGADTWLFKGVAACVGGAEIPRGVCAPFGDATVTRTCLLDIRPISTNATPDPGLLKNQECTNNYKIRLAGIYASGRIATLVVIQIHTAANNFWPHKINKMACLDQRIWIAAQRLRRTTPPSKWNRYGASPSSGRGERPHSQALN